MYRTVTDRYSLSKTYVWYRNNNYSVYLCMQWSMIDSCNIIQSTHVLAASDQNRDKAPKLSRTIKGCSPADGTRCSCMTWSTPTSAPPTHYCLALRVEYNIQSQVQTWNTFQSCTMDQRCSILSQFKLIDLSIIIMQSQPHPLRYSLLTLEINLW